MLFHKCIAARQLIRFFHQANLVRGRACVVFWEHMSQRKSVNIGFVYKKTNKDMIYYKGIY